MDCLDILPKLPGGYRVQYRRPVCQEDGAHCRRLQPDNNPAHDVTLTDRTLTHTATKYFDGMSRTYHVTSTGPGTLLIETETEFDSFGRVLRNSNPHFVGEPAYFTTFGHDGLSRVVTVTKPDNYAVETTYKGPTKEVRSQLSLSPEEWQAPTAYTYDVYQRLVKVTEALGTENEVVTEYEYDTLGNLTAVRAATNIDLDPPYAPLLLRQLHTTASQKKRQMTDPDTGTWTYSYDKAGNLLSQIDANGHETAFDYDLLNRMTKKTFVHFPPKEDSRNPWIRYVYDWQEEENTGRSAAGCPGKTRKGL